MYTGDLKQSIRFGFATTKLSISTNLFSDQKRLRARWVDMISAILLKTRWADSVSGKLTQDQVSRLGKDPEGGENKKMKAI